VAGDDLLRLAGQQVESQAEEGIFVAPGNRQLQVNELDNQSTLGLLGGGERG
jgi:hypothetical protein